MAITKTAFECLGRSLFHKFSGWCAETAHKGLLWPSVLYEIEQRRAPGDQAHLEERVGCPLLGVGAFRVVFGTPTHVVKVSHGTGRANRKETSLWALATARSDLREVLVPVVAADPGGSWLVMERAQPFAALLEFSRGQEGRQVWLSRLFDGIPGDVQIWDVKEDNIGLHDGRVRLFDYGEWTLLDRR